MPRYIDVDAFRKGHRMAEYCEDCERNSRECKYNDFSMMDFCGWLDNAPTVDAVPLDKLCKWLGKVAIVRCNGCSQKPCTGDACSSSDHWEKEIKKWMEGLDAKTD